MTLKVYGEMRRSFTDAKKRFERLTTMSTGNADSEIAQVNKKKDLKSVDETLNLINRGMK